MLLQHQTRSISDDERENRSQNRFLTIAGYKCGKVCNGGEQADGGRRKG